MDEPIHIGGDFTPIRVDIGGEIFVVLVGVAGGVARIVVAILTKRYHCAIGENGNWASPPLSYRPGLVVKVLMVDIQGRSYEIKTTLPGPDKLGPVIGPGWTTYAPLK